jgi:hypothetical protein
LLDLDCTGEDDINNGSLDLDDIDKGNFDSSLDLDATDNGSHNFDGMADDNVEGLLDFDGTKDGIVIAVFVKKRGCHQNLHQFYNLKPEPPAEL